MEEVFIGLPSSVTLDDVRRVMVRHWELDGSMSEPHVVREIGSRAYVAELDRDEVESDPLYFDDPAKPETLRRRVGDDYRLFSLRYTDIELAKEVARTLVESELAQHPMLLDADGTFRDPDEFLAKLGAQPAWDWFSGEKGGERT